jgi:5-methylcytosine-specific restriction protein A
MGSGYFEGAPLAEPHWDEENRANGETALRAPIRFDCLLPSDEVLPVEDLREGPLGEMYWSPPASGFEVPPHLVETLESTWSAFNGVPTAKAWPDDLEGGGTHVEGTATTVTVNRYERDPMARRRCIAAHGTPPVSSAASRSRPGTAHGARASSTSTT